MYKYPVSYLRSTICFNKLALGGNDSNSKEFNYGLFGFFKLIIDYTIHYTHVFVRTGGPVLFLYSSLVVLNLTNKPNL